MKNLFDVRFAVQTINGRSVSKTVEIKARTLYAATEKFWDYADRNNFKVVRVEFNRRTA